MTTIVFRDLPFGEIEVRFPYNTDLVAMLKHAIPASLRTWDKSGKVWHIRDRRSAQRFADYATASGYRVLGIAAAAGPPPSPRPSTPAPADPFVALLRAVGPERSGAVFKALTRVLHPDRPDTGDRALFEQLDAARRQVAA